MRDFRRFERLAGPRMTVEEFMGEAPDLQERMMNFDQLIQDSISLETVRKEWRRLFWRERV